MNLINDVKYELGKLVLSKNQLRKFGLTIGVFILMVTIFLFIKSGISTLIVILSSLGIILAFMGLLFPEKLKFFYQYWMLLAFSLGWIVSRIILTVLFVVIITPIGIILKITKKKFLELNFHSDKKTYWVEKINSDSNIEKMF